MNSYEESSCVEPLSIRTGVSEVDFSRYIDTLTFSEQIIKELAYNYTNNFYFRILFVRIASFERVSYYQALFEVIPLRQIVIYHSNLSFKDILCNSVEKSHDVLRFLLTELDKLHFNLGSIYPELLITTIRKYHDVDAVRILLQEFKFNPNTVQRFNNRTPLSCCIAIDNVSILNELYIAGCNFTLGKKTRTLLKYCLKKKAVNVTITLRNLGLIPDDQFIRIGKKYTHTLMMINGRMNNTINNTIGNNDEFMYFCLRMNSNPKAIVKEIRDTILSLDFVREDLQLSKELSVFVSNYPSD